jgi:hypothetical protein
VQTDALRDQRRPPPRRAARGAARADRDAPSAEESDRRFATFAREITARAPDVVAVARLDSTGGYLAQFPPGVTPAITHAVVPGAPSSGNGVATAALRRAGLMRRTTVTPSIVLRDGRRGLAVYVPVVRNGRVAEYVAAAFAYDVLFMDALAGQLHGEFAYRVIDESNRVIAASPTFPRRVAGLVPRAISLPDGHRWRLELAISSFEPVTGRIIVWSVGLLLLASVTFLVIREEQRGAASPSIRRTSSCCRGTCSTRT